VPAGETVGPWLQRLQQQPGELHGYEYSPLVEVQGWSGVPRGTPLFETLLVVENDPIDGSLDHPGGSPRGSDVRVQEQVNFPLMAVVAPRQEMSLQVSYDGRRFSAAAVCRLLGHWRTILEGLVGEPDRLLEEVPLLDEAERHRVLVEWNAPAEDSPCDR